MPCPYKESCALFPLFSLRASLKTWQIRYCDGEFALCQRYMNAQAGKRSPDTLLPNGKLLPVATK